MRVLVSLDGKQDEAICAVAAYLCEAGRDSVVLFTVVHPDEAKGTLAGAVGRPAQRVTDTGMLLNIPSVTPPAAEARDQAVQRVVDGRSAVLRGLGERYFSHVPVDVRVDIAADPADAILEAAREERVNGMAVGAREQSGLAAAILGSVAQDLVRRSPVPVLVIREGMTPGGV